MDNNNKTLITKIDTKMETIFKEFQSYLMRTNIEFVQSPQTSKQQPMNNV